MVTAGFDLFLGPVKGSLESVLDAIPASGKDGPMVEDGYVCAARGGTPVDFPAQPWELVILADWDHETWVEETGKL